MKVDHILITVLHRNVFLIKWQSVACIIWPPRVSLSFTNLEHGGEGGGVGLFVSSAHKFTAISLPTQTSFEAISGKLECGQSCLIILNIYRPPGPATAFFSELQDILSYISKLPHDLPLMGNFNFRIDSSSSDAGQLSSILDSFDLH